MQAGLTPLTFTVGPRAPPSLQALRGHRVRDPKPGAEGHHRGWARAPHPEPAAPNSSDTCIQRQLRRYRRKLLQYSGEGGKRGVARAKDAPHPTVNTASQKTSKEPGGAEKLFPFFFFLIVLFFPPTGACALQYTQCLFRGAEREALKLFVNCPARGGTFTLIGDDAEAAAFGPDAVGGREREVSAVPDGAVGSPRLVAGRRRLYCCYRLCRLMAAIGVHLGCTSACVAVYKVRQ